MLSGCICMCVWLFEVHCVWGSWWWWCNRSAQLACVFSCHTVLWVCVCVQRVCTVGCIIVGQGIVCLIHWGALSADSEPSLFLPTTRGRIALHLPRPGSCDLTGPTHVQPPSRSTPTNRLSDFIAARPVLDCVSSLWLLPPCCYVLVIQAAYKSYHSAPCEQHHTTISYMKAWLGFFLISFSIHPIIWHNDSEKVITERGERCHDWCLWSDCDYYIWENIPPMNEGHSNKQTDCLHTYSVDSRHQSTPGVPVS